MRALVLVGPTGVGKSELSLKIASYFKDKFEIISADSVQCYRHLDVGSGKMKGDELKGIPHYFIDAVDPDFKVEAGFFCDYADKAVEEIISHQKTPFFVGGTGLYIDAFFKGLSKVPDVDPSYRVSLEMEADADLAKLYDEFLSVDSDAALKVHPNDRQRIIRGLEVYRGTGKPITFYRNNKNPRESEKTLYLGLSLDYSSLYERINTRVDRMIDNGLVEEVQNLLSLGYAPEYNSMKSIGYAEIINFLEKKISLDKAIEQIKSESRRYARRQMIWFRRNKRINWFTPDQYNDIITTINGWLINFEGE